MWWETLIVILLVAASIAYLAKRWFGPGQSSGCGGCGCSCPGSGSGQGKGHGDDFACPVGKDFSA
ncbi:MAG: FeoB-associated Cys-rich membrane protein [Desulfovibrio sp.]|nr:MAG: FeoB-associated Cys-rich membrane protein [Desulfovibrio sp.]